MMRDELDERPNCQSCGDSFEDFEKFIFVGNSYPFHKICWEKLTAADLADLFGYRLEELQLNPVTIFKLEDVEENVSAESSKGNNNY
jgi:hypothetical protein